MEIEETASQSTVSRFARQQTELVIDIDSMYFYMFGKQEDIDYNTNYGTYVCHPLVTYDGVYGDFLKAEVHPGNVYTSTKSNRTRMFVSQLTYTFMISLRTTAFHRKLQPLQ